MKYVILNVATSVFYITHSISTGQYCTGECGNEELREIEFGRQPLW
jgi:hypothetical protein